VAVSCIDQQVNDGYTGRNMVEHGMRQIEDRWAALALATHLNAALVWDVIARYSEPHRHYHVLSHILKMLTAFDEHRERCDHPLEVEYAIFMHDIIYDPRASDNEARSADLAVEWIGRSHSTLDAALVHRLIMATTHRQISTMADARLLVDIDTLVFSGSDDEYDEYSRAIRQEYSWVPSEIYVVERIRVLNTFLSRDQLFTSNVFGPQTEAVAVANILREIKSLESNR
jgi:predicted metal-dependent HD superfamily phosphohydrolase